MLQVVLAPVVNFLFFCAFSALSMKLLSLITPISTHHHHHHHRRRHHHHNF